MDCNSGQQNVRHKWFLVKYTFLSFSECCQYYLKKIVLEEKLLKNVSETLKFGLQVHCQYPLCETF